MGTLQEELTKKIIPLQGKYPFFPGWKLDIGASPTKLCEEFKDFSHIRISICSGVYKIIQIKQVIAVVKGYEIEFQDVIKSMGIFKTVNKLLKYFKTNKYLSYDKETGNWFINTEEKGKGDI